MLGKGCSHPHILRSTENIFSAKALNGTTNPSIVEWNKERDVLMLHAVYFYYWGFIIGVDIFFGEGVLSGQEN